MELVDAPTLRDLVAKDGPLTSILGRQACVRLLCCALAPGGIHAAHGAVQSPGGTELNRSWGRNLNRVAKLDSGIGERGSTLRAGMPLIIGHSLVCRTLDASFSGLRLNHSLQ